MKEQELSQKMIDYVFENKSLEKEKLRENLSRLVLVEELNKLTIHFGEFLNHVPKNEDVSEKLEKVYMQLLEISDKITKK